MPMCCQTLKKLCFVFGDLMFYRDIRKKTDGKRYARKTCHDICDRLRNLNSLKTENVACDEQYRNEEQAVSK